MNKFYLLILFVFVTSMANGKPKTELTNYVNPFLGTATLWEPEDLGYVRKMKQRTWGAEVFPGSSLPNAMVQLSPVTQFRSGAGYQYEDTVIYGFSHTNKGHWNLLHVPYYPYFAYMFREANAWNSLFFAPHDPQGMIALYPDAKAVEQKLDSLFSEPWRGYEVHNLTGFIGNYCHGNQPGHSIPYTYYFIGKQEKEGNELVIKL